MIKTILISASAVAAFASLFGACLDPADGESEKASTTFEHGPEGNVVSGIPTPHKACANADIQQGPQNGPLTFTPPNLFQNNGPPAPVDGIEKGNAGLLGNSGSLKCLHGGPGSTGQPLPTDGQLGQMTLPIVDSVCFAASPGNNGCSVLAQECAATGGAGGPAAGQVYGCTGSVYVQNGAEYCDGQWQGCDGNPPPASIGGLMLTQGNGAPKGAWSGKCGGDTDTATEASPIQIQTLPLSPVMD